MLNLNPYRCSLRGWPAARGEFWREGRRAAAPCIRRRPGGMFPGNQVPRVGFLGLLDSTGYETAEYMQGPSGGGGGRPTRRGASNHGLGLGKRTLPSSYATSRDAVSYDGEWDEACFVLCDSANLFSGAQLIDGQRNMVRCNPSPATCIRRSMRSEHSVIACLAGYQGQPLHHAPPD